MVFFLMMFFGESHVAVFACSVTIRVSHCDIVNWQESWECWRMPTTPKNSTPSRCITVSVGSKLPLRGA